MLTRSLLPNFDAMTHWLSIEDDGGDGGDGGSGGGGNDDGQDGKEKEDGGKTFSQADLDAHAGRRAAEAKRQAERSLAESLGVPVAEAKRIIEQARKAEDEKKSEADRLRDEAAAAKAEADAAKAEAAAERNAARIERALVKAKIRDDRIDKALRLLDVEHDASAEDVAAAVEAFKKETPEFFSSDAADDDGKSGGPGAPPPSDPKGKPKPPKSEDAFARGAERAKKAAAGTATYPILQNQ